ncbi:hypothetical protein CDD83_1141 [Cordyceps sp. RAO-2017]|nr:hypothetical protein CDD83_1141 [Cordyceps sp. RAO-2017]
MKVIESQSAVLSNYEVYQHLVEQRQSYKLKKRRGPPNLETVVKELLVYFRTKPGPLGQEPLPYHPGCVSELLERLRPYELSKGELVVILNLRPDKLAALNTVVEDMTERFTAEQQEEILDIIAQVLGQPDAADAEQVENGADASMADATAA